MVTKLDKIDPVWFTKDKPLRGKTGGAAGGTTAAPKPPSGLRAGYHHVPYGLDSPDLGGELARKAILFRALYGLWDGTNVAVCKYTTTSGEIKYIVAISGAGSHSEGRIVQYLRAQTDVARIDGLYTEREPCNGADRTHHCENLLKQDPAMASVPVFATFPYDRNDEEYKKTNDKLVAAGEELARTPGIRKQAFDDAKGSDTVHVLPVVYTFPFVQEAAVRSGAPDLVTSADGAFAFKSSDVAALKEEKKKS